MTETITSQYDPEVDLRVIKSRKNGSTREFVAPETDERCYFDVDLPMSKLRGLSNEQVYDLLQGPITDCLMKAYLGVLSVNPPRGFECEVKGGASDKGWGVEGGCRFRF